MTSDFKKLEVWKGSIDLTKQIYEIAKGFPVNEQFGLTSQLRRAVISIPNNIAEGCGRSSDADFLRFLYMSFGSLKETENLLILSKEFDYLKGKDFNDSAKKIEGLGKMLNSLIATVKMRRSNP